MKTLEQLLAMQSKALKGAPMPVAEVEQQMAAIGQWRFDRTRGALVRRFEFADFHETMEFVNAVAWMIHGEDHHPDMAIGYDRCELAFNTHSVGGISINDFICAAKCDAIRSIRSAR
jgi:4a-hydroxytetrahydrobiopterin dehydratase